MLKTYQFKINIYNQAWEILYSKYGRTSSANSASTPTLFKGQKDDNTPNIDTPRSREKMLI